MYNQLINEWKHLSAPIMSCWASFIRIRNAIIKSAVSGLLSDKLQGLHTSLPQPQLSPPLSISINSWLHRAGSPGMGCGLCQRWSWHHNFSTPHSRSQNAGTLIIITWLCCQQHTLSLTNSPSLVTTSDRLKWLGAAHGSPALLPPTVPSTSLDRAAWAGTCELRTGHCETV